MTPAKILFILVLYYNDEEAKTFFKTQLTMQSCQDYQVLLVNNGSNSLEKLVSAFKGEQNVEIIGAGENLGYFGGAAYALDYFRRKYTTLPSHVIISNMDLEFVEPSFLENLINEKSNFDLAGPSIISASSHVDLNPFSKTIYSKSKLHFLKFIFSFYPFYLIYQTMSLIKRKFKGSNIGSSPSNNLEDVYALHGSFMVFRPGFFEKGGNFNFGSFLYGEELFVAEQARRKAMRSVFLPSLKLIHKEHTTTGTYKSRKHIGFMKDSINYLLKNFFHDR